jgi:cell division protein FtsL
VLIISGLFIYLQPHITLLKYGYLLHDLKNQYRALREENVRLKLEKAGLSSLERVAKIAQEKLGLTPPRDNQITPIILSEAESRGNQSDGPPHQD